MDAVTTNIQASRPNLQSTSSAPSQEGQKSNSFGIGEASRSQVELSPQARILQQNEQQQLSAQKQLNESRQQETGQEEQEAVPPSTSYVRVSSSAGSAQTNNLTSEKATELYRSIEKLL